MLKKASSTEIQAEIREAIRDAIAANEHSRLQFNEDMWTRETEADKEFYALPADYVSMITLSILLPDRRVLTPENNESIEKRPIRTDAPMVYSMFKNQYRLWPIPNDTYTLKLFGVKSFPVLEADDDSNPWTNEAFEFIREAAAARIFYTTLQELQAAQVAAGEAETRKRALENRFRLRQPPMRAKPWL